MPDTQFISSPSILPPYRVPLAEALREGWLEIWYQPKIDLRRKCLAGAESLARIHHPQDGLLWPESFLPTLDDAELAALACHGLETVLGDWTDFAAAGFNLKLAVNLPVRALNDVPIADMVAERRPQANDWPGLMLEVNEGEIVRDVKLVRTLAPALKAAGVTLALDDFGAGYSSFASLRDLPFDALKIDAAFVKDCAADPDNAAICQTAIDLAHRFGGVAVAEGVESRADLQALVVMGCDFGQGVTIAPAMPKARFLGLLRERANAARARSQYGMPAGDSPIVV
jgi:EAL domain-containing protein (putative c-di-GMP-specific phosphodiesterase class I)